MAGKFDPDYLARTFTLALLYHWFYRQHAALHCSTQGANYSRAGTAYASQQKFLRTWGLERSGRFKHDWEGAQTCPTIFRIGRRAWIGEPTSGLAILTISLLYAAVADGTGASSGHGAALMKLISPSERLGAQSSSCSCSARSAVLASSPAPENAAACSTNPAFAGPLQCVFQAR
jgi:hypothetical protein